MEFSSEDKIKIIPLGGVEEIGFNCTVFEFREQLVVVDMGLGFPDNSMYGVDYLVPNIDYLVKRKSAIEGIVITHGHLDHIGGLPFLLPLLDFPEVLGTEFTLELIKTKLEEHGILDKAKLRLITPDSKLVSGHFSLSFFSVNHSIPQCVGVVIETPAARIVHTGDFKFDNSPVNEPVADYARIARIGESGVDVLLSDSTNSLRKGHPVSESDVASSLGEVMQRAPGRLVVASFSGLVGRLYQLIKIAEGMDRKVAIAGYSMQQTLRIAQQIGYISPKKGLLVPIQKINRFNDDRVMILTTGSQGESNAALSKLASKDGYKNIKLKPSDTVILSAGTIPGNNVHVQTLIDAISDTGAKVQQSESMDFYTSGHGYQEDQKIMLNLVKPKFFIPVHGYQYFLRAHAQTAMQVGVAEDRILVPLRGLVIEGNRKHGFRKTEVRVKNTPLLVAGSGVGEVGEELLSERHQLANYGVLVINVVIDRKTKRLIYPPLVFSKGFIYVKTRGDFLNEIKDHVVEIVDKQLKKKGSVSSIKDAIEDGIGKFAKDATEREPVILSVVNIVNNN